MKSSNFRLSQTGRKVASAPGTSDLESPNEACNAIKGNLITPLTRDSVFLSLARSPQQVLHGRASSDRN